MAYDEALANRIRRTLSERGDVVEKRMFGGLAFMVGGHMCCGIVGKDMMVRVGAEAHAQALAAPHAREMDFTGRPLTSMVYVSPAGFKTDQALQIWVERGLAFVTSLPARPAKRLPPPKPRRRRS